MNSISSSCTSSPNYWGSGAIAKNYSAVQFSQIAVSSKENKEITIVTDEGDKITIAYDHQINASYSNFKALSYQKGFARCEDMALTEEMRTKMQGERFLFEES